MLHNIIDRLWVGDDTGYEKIEGKPGWSILRCCKEGPGGHRQTLGYTTLGAPQGPNYLWVRRKNKLALNILDLEDPQMIPDKVIDKGLEFIKERMDAGDKVLVACNAGHSRSPSLVMLYLHSINELPQPFNRAKTIFKAIYEPFSPGHGMLWHLHNRW